MKKLVIIGPVHPYRGGISHFTTRLSQELKKSAEIINYNFSRLYPKIFYPGAFQKEPNSNTNQNLSQKIDTLNPFTWLKTIREINKFDFNRAISRISKADLI